MAALDLSNPTGLPLTVTVLLQDAGTDVRVVLLPTSGRYKLTIGSGYSSSGHAEANQVELAYSFAATLSDDDAAPSLADGSERRVLASGAVDEWLIGPGVSGDRSQVAIWGSANGYCELSLERVK